MREILFRGKTNKVEWVEGLLWKKKYNTNKLFISCFPDKDDNEEVFVVCPETIGQYTGFTDKNGKKIFEGDCWLDTDGDYIVYVVEFRDGQFGFACYGWQGALMPYGFDEDAGGWGEIEFEPMTNFIIKNIEIIGNIHDNPELLKGEQEWLLKIK